MDKEDIVPPTPESFSRKKGEKKDNKDSEQTQEQLKDIQEDDIMSSNPYLERGYTFPYQVAQNRYQEPIADDHNILNVHQRQQVFGHSQYRPVYHGQVRQDYRQEPQDDRQVFGHNEYRPVYHGQVRQDYRQEPQDDRSPRPQAPRTDRYGAHPLQVDRERRPEYYDDFVQGDNHRALPAGAHRGGRPDLGFYQEKPIHVPYPQEPDRVKYVPPPKIGFDPYKDPEPSRPKSETQVRSARSSRTGETEPNPGWYLMMRFHKDGAPQVTHALTMCQKHIETDGGRILGMAKPYGILIHEGGDAWVTYGRMRNFGDYWDVQKNPKEERTDYCVLVIFYPSLSKAIQWFDRDGFFKQKDFPYPYATDCIVLPVHGSADTRFLRTLALTEYPKITHPEYFRDKFACPTEDLMKQKYRASPYVVKASSVPVDDPRQRVARHLRGCWIKRNSVITVSLFESLQEAVRYYSDEEYFKCKDCQDRVSAPTTVIMDLESWKA